MESYTYLFLFVLQLVFTVVVLLALLHEKRLQKQLEKKNKQLLTELLNLRGEIRAMRSTYLTFTGKIVRISVSTTTASEELKKLISVTEKLKKELDEGWGKKRNRKYGHNEYERISHYYRQTREGENVIDDITWNDLSMDDVFLSLIHI